MVRVVLAMRASFLEDLKDYLPLLDLFTRDNIEFIIDMDPDELRQAIEQPAAKHGVLFEEGLVEQIIEDVQGRSGYLTMLQCFLDMLWKVQDMEHRVLEFSTYSALGGAREFWQTRIDQQLE